MFNHFTRQMTLNQAESQTWDLLIVGGGITGAGVARDAASRGMKVLVAEAKDFASGTSSRSSKLIHGGIRYLENMEFGLVHEALTERRRLLEMAPHLVHPLRFLIPIYQSSRVGLVKMEMGMMLYDLLSLFDAPKVHEAHRSKWTLQKEPQLNREGLKGSVIYSDAYMEDDRLVIETLRSAQTLGAQSVNYARVMSIEEDEHGCSATLLDTLKGQQIQVRARQVVGCVGPWTDIFGRDILKNWKKSLRPTKGIHLIFPREKLPVSQAIVMAVEKRIIFVIPRDEIVIVGTTDTDFDKDPGDVLASTEDVDYLLAATNKYFPELHLEKKDIISCYSGIRPLVDDGAQTEGKTSREHHIFKHSPHVTLVAGGKYTTYRSMAEEIVDGVLKNFPFEERMKWGPSKTISPLNPAATQEKMHRATLQAPQVAKDHNLPLDLVRSIMGRHGEEAYSILNYMRLMPNGEAPERRWRAEAKFSIENEMCLNLTDFYWRRSPLFLFHQDNGMKHLRALALTFAATLGWSDGETQEQMESVVSQAAKEKQALISANI